jgi:RNA polymerase sigma factor (TIGR02999 family)
MDPIPQREVTLLLQRAQSGDIAAQAELVPLIYDELLALARSNLAGHRAAHTLNSTALVHECWMRLQALGGGSSENRRQYLALASKVMRSVLVDHARARGAVKRGGNALRLTLAEDLAATDDQALDLLDLDAALTALSAEDGELARMVELRYFAGLSNVEVAELLGASLRTVERGIQVAKLWLHDRLG